MVLHLTKSHWCLYASETIIVAYQEKEEALITEKEKAELMGKIKPGDDEMSTKPNIVVPDIPRPPTPPRVQELYGWDKEKFVDRHPIYFPKGQESIVAHLDRSCFHIVDGRYFGLQTNQIADPHYVGPNAPGVGGLNLSGGTGLATANSGGGGSTSGTALLAAPAQTGASVIASSGHSKGASSTKSSKKTTAKDGSTSATATEEGSNGTGEPKNEGGPSKKKNDGATPTASASDLRKIMEDGGELAELMKTCIIRSAVHASRLGKHSQSFKAPDGHIYPDVSKAFAAHAGLKPCIRCKNNKQGVRFCQN